MGLSQKDQTKHNTLLRLGNVVGKNNYNSSTISITILTYIFPIYFIVYYIFV